MHLTSEPVHDLDSSRSQTNTSMSYLNPNRESRTPEPVYKQCRPASGTNKEYISGNFIQYRIDCRSMRDAHRCCIWHRRLSTTWVQGDYNSYSLDEHIQHYKLVFQVSWSVFSIHIQSCMCLLTQTYLLLCVSLCMPV